MVRAFIAVDISSEARDALAEVQRSLQGQGVTSVRWVRPEGVHLTLKFLGEIDSVAVGGIMDGLKRAAKGIGPLNLCLGEIGAFPSVGAPRVIWVGMEGDLERLRALQGQIDEEMHSAGGFPREGRPFAPHLTLGRMRENATGGERRGAGEALTQVALESAVSWEVKEVNLMRSTLTPQGAVYDVLGCQLL